MALLLFGHRGAASEAPENTMVGFDHAYKQASVRCFEFDVRLTKDEQLAVIHDATIDRTTDGTGKVIDYTLGQLQRFNASKIPFIHAAIPSLGEVLDTYSETITQFQIEIKPEVPEIIRKVAKRVVDAIASYRIAEKSVVTSFDPYAIECVHTLDANQRCGLIAFDYTIDVLDTAGALGCYNVCIPITTANGKELVMPARKGVQIGEGP